MAAGTYDVDVAAAAIRRARVARPVDERAAQARLRRADDHQPRPSGGQAPAGAGVMARGPHRPPSAVPRRAGAERGRPPGGPRPSDGPRKGLAGGGLAVRARWPRRRGPSASTAAAGSCARCGSAWRSPALCGRSGWAPTRSAACGAVVRKTGACSRFPTLAAILRAVAPAACRRADGPPLHARRHRRAGGAIPRPFVRPGAGTAALPGDLGRRLRVHRGRRASGRSRCAWWPASCGRGGCCGSGATSCRPCAGRRSRSAPTPCSWPTTPRAELGCFLALGWPMPARILDLFAEFRATTNGLRTCRAARACWVPCSGTAWTPWPPMRRPRCATWCCAAGRGRRTSAGRSWTTARPTWTRWPHSSRACCQPSSAASATPRIALGQALLRGRYMAAAARMEWTGVPIDTAMLARLRAGWDGDQGAADRGGRRPLRRLRGQHLQGGPLRRLPRRQGHSLAAPALRRAGARRQHLPRPGQGLAGAAAPARAAPRPGRAAAGGPGRGHGRPQPLPALRLPLAHRPQPAQQHASSSSARRPGCAR